MLLLEIKTRTEQLIEQHLHQSWKVQFITKKKLLGQCCYATHEIRLNKYWSCVLPENEILDTILHEIAHAKCFELDKNDSHGPTWRMIAKELGAKPLACYNGSVSVPSRYIAKCSCGSEYKSGNIKTAYKFCSFCRKPLQYINVYAKLNLEETNA